MPDERDVETFVSENDSLATQHTDGERTSVVAAPSPISTNAPRIDEAETVFNDSETGETSLDERVAESTREVPPVTVPEGSEIVAAGYTQKPPLAAEEETAKPPEAISSIPQLPVAEPVVSAAALQEFEPTQIEEAAVDSKEATTAEVEAPSSSTQPALVSERKGTPAAGARPDSAAAPETASAAPATSAGAEVGAAPTPPAPTIDTSSSESILQSLAEVSPSSAGQALEKAIAAVPDLQTREKKELEASYPTVERPTGLPRKSEKKSIKPTTIESGKPSETGGETGRKGKPPETNHIEPKGPVPGTEVSTAVTETKAEDDSSWWSRLFDRIRNFVRSLPTRDPGVSTSAGPRPRVDTTGDADPAQNTKKKQAADEGVTARRGQADTATSQDFGENDVYPEVPTETLRPSYKAGEGPAAPASPGQQEPGLAGQDRALFDQTASTWYTGQVNAERDKYDQEQETYEHKSLEARADGQRRIEEETAKTRAEQEEMQQQARGDVEAERGRWREQNRKIQQDYASKSEAKRKEIDNRVADEVKTAEAESDRKLTEAETRANEERRKAEAKARAEKAKAKKKKRSWWERVKGAVSSAFAAIKKAVNAIFDGLRKLVKGIIEAAKAAVRGIIELARRAIVGLIKAFGEALKVFVSVALAAFPEAAAKARAWIDRRVDQAVDAVNKAAEALKQATDAILDFVGEVLDTALAVVQKIYNAIIDVVKFLVIGLLEIMEKIGYLVSAARQMPDHFWGQAQEEVIGMNLEEPLPFERTAPPQRQDVAATGQEAGLISAQDAAVVNRSQFSADEVAVDQVAMLDEMPAFIADLDLQEGQEFEFGESPDPTRTIESIKGEVLGTAPATPGPPPGVAADQAALSGRTPAAMTPEEELLELMKEKPEGGCAKEKQGEPAKGGEVPEALKKGPFTPGQRGRYLWHQMKQGIKQWFHCNWPWLLGAAVAALLGFIAANILTGGAVMAALPLLMQIVGAIMIGVAIVRVTAYVADYVRQGWSGNIGAAAKSLARGLAVGAVELIFALLFNLGAVIKAMKAGLKASAKAAATAAKTTVRTTIRNVRQVGRLGLQGGKAAIRNGKILMTGVRSGVVKGARSLDDLARRLWERVRFRKFKIRIKNRKFQLLGHLNPWVLLAEGQLLKVDQDDIRLVSGDGPAHVGDIVRYGRKHGIVVASHTDELGRPVSAFGQELYQLQSVRALKQQYRRLRDVTPELRRARITGTKTFDYQRAVQNLGADAANTIRDRGRLASALGKAPGPDFNAHHIIPVELIENSPALREAIAAGFEFNGKMNGRWVSRFSSRSASTQLGRHAYHPNYTKRVLDRVAHFDAAKLTGNDARKAFEELASAIGKVIDDAPTTKIDDLVF